MGANNKDGIYKAFHRCTGEELWSTDIVPMNVPGFETGVYGSPSGCYDGRYIYTICVFAPKPTTVSEGKVPLEFGQLVACIFCGGLGCACQTQECFENLGSTLFGYFFGAQTYIQKIDPKDGNILATFVSQTTSTGGLTHANGVLYYGDFSGKMYALDAETLLPKFEEQVSPFGIIQTITIQNGKIFIPTAQNFGEITEFPGGGLTVYSPPV